MGIEQEPLRYAHAEGHTDVCYTDDGKYFITVGADGDIRIWPTENSDDPIHNCIGEWALSVRQKGDKIYVATSSNDIQVLSMPEGDRDGVVGRFTAPINHIAISQNLIALAGEDMEIKLVDLDTNKQLKVFSGLAGPCLSVALSEDKRFLAASSGDKKLRLYEVESEKIVKELECFPKCNSFENADLLCRLDFQPSGNILAYPQENSVTLMNIDDFSTKSLKKEDSKSISIVQFSPCGKYLAASTENGEIIIWNVDNSTVLSTIFHPKQLKICGFMWNPLNNGQIVYTDIEGQLSVVSKCLGKEVTKKESKAPKNVEENDVDEDMPQTIEEELENFEEMDDNDLEGVAFDQEEDDDNENAISVEKLKREIMGVSEDDEKSKVSAASRRSSPRPRTPELPLQDAFMPSSTPMHLDPRYLCWNDVGIIKCYGNNAEDESASKSIEIDFHDTAVHHSLMMPNYQDYNLGSVSKSAVVVANSSQIKVIPLGNSTKEWSLKVEEFEEIVLVAASENIIAFALATYIVKVCTIFGTQRAIFAIPGPLVSMAAFQNNLLIAYHQSGVRKCDQSINFKLVKLEGYAIESKDMGAALGPDSTLSWIGFSELGTPAMMDSLGLISLYPSSCNIWIPFCDTTKYRSSPSDGFFPTTIFEGYQTVGGIKCRGAIYPTFTPQPTMTELPIEPPFAESGTEKTQMEMKLFTWSNLQVDDTEKKFKETALKMFALSCRNDFDQRALEFMELLANPQIINLAIKYATKLDKRRLAEKLMDFAMKLTSDEENNDCSNELRSDLNNDNSLPNPIRRKLVLNTKKSAAKKPSTEKSTNKEEVVAESEKSQDIFSSTATSVPDTRLKENNSDCQNSLMDASLTPEQPRNPFLKTLKMAKIAGPNPLSLTDRNAGVVYEKENAKADSAEKRKQPESETEKQKEKQRKLDKFIFSKNK